MPHVLTGASPLFSGSFRASSTEKKQFTVNMNSCRQVLRLGEKAGRGRNLSPLIKALLRRQSEKSETTCCVQERRVSQEGGFQSAASFRHSGGEIAPPCQFPETLDFGGTTGGGEILMHGPHTDSVVFGSCDQRT